MYNEIHELRTAFEAIAGKLSTAPRQARTVAAPRTVEILVEKAEAKPYAIEVEVTSCES